MVGEYFYKDKLYIKNDFYYPLKEEEKDKVVTKVKLVKLHGYWNNDKVGVIEVFLDGKHIHTENIYVSKKKTQSSIFKKIMNWFS